MVEKHFNGSHTTALQGLKIWGQELNKLLQLDCFKFRIQKPFECHYRVIYETNIITCFNNTNDSCPSKQEYFRRSALSAPGFFHPIPVSITHM